MKKYTATEFSERLASLVSVAEKIDALISRVDALSGDIREFSRRESTKTVPRTPNVQTSSMKALGKLLYSVPQAADLLSMHAHTLRVYIKLGKIPVRHIGRSWRIHHSDLEKFARQDMPSVHIKSRRGEAE